MAFAADIHRDGDVSNPRLGTELMTTSISSTFTTVAPELYESILLGLDAVEHANARQRGYLVCEVTDIQWDAHFRVVSTALTPGSTLSTDRTLSIAAVA
jgi:phosphodiesterase/alkaline phosphatase D-like protein